MMSTPPTQLSALPNDAQRNPMQEESKLVGAMHAQHDTSGVNLRGGDAQDVTEQVINTE